MQPESVKSTPNTLNRGEFLRSLGLSSGALMALYCMGTLTSCSSGDDPAPVTPPPTPTPGTGTNTTGLTGNTDSAKGAIDFTLDLSNANYSKLKTAGDFVQVNNFVVANAKGIWVALSNVCTHQGGQLQYRTTENDFRCNLHGGLFNNDGTVKQSPPAKAVVAYKAVLTGNNLRVTA